MFTILRCLPFARCLQDFLFLEQETPPMLGQIVIAGGNIFIVALDEFFFFFRSRVRIMRQPVGVLYAYQDKGFDSAGKNCFC